METVAPHVLHLKNRVLTRSSVPVKAFTDRGRALTLSILMVAFLAKQLEKWKNQHHHQHHVKLAWTTVYAGVMACLAFSLVLRFVFFSPSTSPSKISSSNRFSPRSALSSVASLKTMSRIQTSLQSMNTSSMRLLSLASRCSIFRGQHQDRTRALAGGDPFLEPQITENLTLSDIRYIFEHAAQGNQMFLQSADAALLEARRRPALHKALESMDAALVFARGEQVLPTMKTGSTIEKKSYADMDVLSFVAACRIFAEWRTVRLVPDGYPRYAMGMGIARRDLVQNLAKIENAVHSYWKPGELRPTIRQLLEREARDAKSLPRLMDPSGASGLLWTMRQVRYQTRIFHNVAQIPLAFPDSRAANQAAYDATYRPYHGFFTRQIFQGTFDVSPRADIVAAHMILPLADDELDEWSGKADSLTHSMGSSEEAPSQQDDPEEDDDMWFHLDIEPSSQRDLSKGRQHALDLEPHRLSMPKEAHSVSKRVETNKMDGESIKHTGHNPLEQVGHHIAKEWDKFIMQCTGGGLHHDYHSSLVLDRHYSSFHRSSVAISRHENLNNAMLLPPDDAASSHQSIANREFHTFVEFMDTLLSDVEELIISMNMNDPSKV